MLFCFCGQVSPLVNCKNGRNCDHFCSGGGGLVYISFVSSSKKLGWHFLWHYTRDVGRACFWQETFIGKKTIKVLVVCWECATFAVAIGRASPISEVDPLAQLVEHIPFKDGVLGSNPKRITVEAAVLPLFLCPFRNGRPARTGSEYFLLSPIRLRPNGKGRFREIFLRRRCTKTVYLLGVRK